MFKPTLAKTWDENDNPRNWVMSEKLDGVRAIWTGSELLTRNHKPIHAPEWFLQQLPKSLPLDGELWIDRGQFQKTASTVRKKSPVDSEWKQIKYMVFDTPHAAETGLVHATRMELIRAHCISTSNIRIVGHTICRDQAHLERLADKVIANNGEGVMLRRADTPYEFKRTGNLRKYKRFMDSDATVIGYEPGKGKHEGVVGALKVRMDGVEFRVGSGLSDAQRVTPPKVGALIIFQHDGFTESGKPRFPTFLGQRADA